jgi:hypothetical protein
MEGINSNQEKPKRNAEDWVSIARDFGEKCVEIQKDSQLSIDQKLEKQRVVGNEMAKEIQADSHLKDEDKRQMIDSINNYMDEWKVMHDLIQKGPSTESIEKQKKQ